MKLFSNVGKDGVLCENGFDIFSNHRATLLSPALVFPIVIAGYSMLLFCYMNITKVLFYMKYVRDGMIVSSSEVNLCCFSTSAPSLSMVGFWGYRTISMRTNKPR